MKKNEKNEQTLLARARRLMLNRETMRVLTNAQLGQVAGGTTECAVTPGCGSLTCTLESGCCI